MGTVPRRLSQKEELAMFLPRMPLLVFAFLIVIADTSLSNQTTALPLAQFDWPVEEEALTEDGSVASLMGVRWDGSLDDKSGKILEEQKRKEGSAGDHFPAMNNEAGWDTNKMGDGTVKILQKRAVDDGKKKMAKNKKILKGKKGGDTKKKEQNTKSRKGKRVETKKEPIRKNRKLGNKGENFAR